MSVTGALLVLLLLLTLHPSLLVMGQLSRSPQLDTRPFLVRFTLIMSLLLLILFKIFYLFIILLLTIGVLCSLTRLAWTCGLITRCNSSGPLYTMRMPSHPAPSPTVSTPLALVSCIGVYLASMF
jgi:hypothetical protein